MIQKCNQCGKPNRVLIKVHVYHGEDKDWGPQYSDEQWCWSCVSQESQQPKRAEYTVRPGGYTEDPLP